MIPTLECHRRSSRGRNGRRCSELTFVHRDPIGIEQLEARLLRRGIRALGSGRCRCSGCGRTPLAGELVHLYAERPDELLCELCRVHTALTPAATARVQQHGRAVRALPRAA